MLKAAYPDSMNSAKFWEEQRARHTSHILMFHTTLNKYHSTSFTISAFLKKKCMFPNISSFLPIISPFFPPKNPSFPIENGRFSGYHRVAQHGITRWNCYQRLGAPGRCLGWRGGESYSPLEKSSGNTVRKWSHVASFDQEVLVHNRKIETKRCQRRRSSLLSKKYRETFEEKSNAVSFWKVFIWDGRPGESGRYN